MADTFYFYDLETSGFNPREARIMQFAGQRTDMDLNPLGEPTNVLIKLGEDVLPDPEAILITGITPQQTLVTGRTEAEFLALFTNEIASPGTIFVGYNTVRFDDEFMRYLHYRNFYDPYEWQWQDERSRWDLLDVVRMTRALRPQGIKWPIDSVQGRPTNRLELLAAENGLDHRSAHDALSDVQVSIALARLLRQRQPRLFNYLLQLRDKKQIAKLVYGGEPFIYTSGKYPSELEKTTVVATVAEHPTRSGALVYDLRHDPAPFAELSATELAAAWSRYKAEDGLILPIKTLQFNRCPAVAPLSVLDEPSRKRLKIDRATIQVHHATLQTMDNWRGRLLEAQTLLDSKQQKRWQKHPQPVDAQLYDGFFDKPDKTLMSTVRSAKPEQLAGLQLNFRDARLRALLPLYKARNYPQTLSSEERETWEAYRTKRLVGGQDESWLHRYYAALTVLAQKPNLTKEQHYLLEELQLYGQSIMPAVDR